MKPNKQYAFCECIARKTFDVAFVSIILCVILALSLFIQAEAADIEQVDRQYLSPRNAIGYDQQWYVISLDPREPIVCFCIGVCPVQFIELQRLSQDPMFGTANSGIEYKLTMRQAPGTFRIIHYDAIKNNDGLPDMFEVQFVSNDPNFPRPHSSLRWIQFIYTSYPSKDNQLDRNLPTPYVDPQTNTDNWPFYYDDELAQQNSGRLVDTELAYMNFTDRPCRPLCWPAINWQAHLYIVEFEYDEEEFEGTVWIYDGIEWGFNIRRCTHKMYGPGADWCGGVGARDYFGTENCTEPGPYIEGFDPVDVIEFVAYPTDLVPGQTTNIALTIENQGELDMTDFNVTVYADQNMTVFGDEIVVGTQWVDNLPINETMTLDFSWDTTNLPYGAYVISAEAPIPEYYDLDDFPMPGRIVDNRFILVLRLVGDVDENGNVDIRDITTIALAFGSDPEHPRWDPRADLDHNGAINIRDVTAAAMNFGRTAEIPH